MCLAYGTVSRWERARTAREDVKVKRDGLLDSIRTSHVYHNSMASIVSACESCADVDLAAQDIDEF